MNSEERRNLSTPASIVHNTKNMILTDLLGKLEDIIKDDDEKEIYIEDIINACVDANTPHDDRMNFELIKYLDNENYIDMSVVDAINLHQFLLTLSYESLYQGIINDDFFIKIINDFPNKKIKNNETVELIEKIKEYKNDNDMVNVVYKDNETQIYISFPFDLDRNDFECPYFGKNQVVDLCGSIKIFTTNFKMNKNAIVLEGVNKHVTRVYLMEKDPELDIRDFFKYTPSIIENDYNLNITDYTEGKIRKEFENKKHLIYVLNQMANELTRMGDMK